MVSRKAKIGKPADETRFAGSQPGAKAAAKEQRLKDAGTTTRQKGHNIASNAKREAKRDG